MFNNCINTKQQGNIGIAHAMLYFSKQGYTISVPINDSQDYDLVVDIDNVLHKVQVKTSSQLSDYNVPQVCLKSSGGTKGKIYSTVASSNATYLYILHSNGDSWFMPITSDLPKSSMNLGDKYLKYKLA